MSAGIDPRRFRDLMAGVCAPVTVVTVADEGGVHGATVSSFASLSLDPPLITIALDERSSLLPRLVAAGRFGVNLLGHGQDELARRFARPAADRFAEVDWHLDGGLPRLDGAAGWLVCDVHDAVPGGDHRLLMGHVVEAGRAELAPLIYAYRTFGTHSRFDRRPRALVADQIAACAR
ncbi:MAG TPA: flavin reductase family protein [Actinocrinis sp.]|nr:flavin reductase family protein [Actinocrinis sp.]